MVHGPLHCTHGDGDRDTDGIDDSIEDIRRVTRTNGRDRYAECPSDQAW